jgi:2-methylisocitrate lyase-like PEP mutase family enzyme
MLLPNAAAVIARIVAALDVAVSADIEAGYSAVAATVTAVLQAGAADVNIEDRRDGAGSTSRPSKPASWPPRAAARGIPFWINARTDVFLAGTRRIDDALERSAAYAAAGADSLFVPGLVDPAAIAELARGPLPVAVMAWSGAPSVAELAAAGAVPHQPWLRHRPGRLRGRRPGGHPAAHLRNLTTPLRAASPTTR